MEEQVMPATDVRHRRRPAVATIGAILLGIVTIVAVQVAHMLPGADTTLVEMGFDPDRARLISSLALGTIAAAGASVVTGGRTAPVLVGLAVFVRFYASTFWAETTSALASSGATGRFDPPGWALTMATLVLAGYALCWAASRVALAVRDGLRPVGRTVGGLWMGRRPTRRAAGGLLATAVVLVVVAVVGSTFGDLVNFSPDVHMRAGAPAQIGLFVGPTTVQPTAEPGSGGSPGSGGGATRPSPLLSPLPTPPPGYRLVAGPLPGSLVTSGVLASGQPWAAHPPSGPGRVVSTTLPAPWTGGTSSTAALDIYLPPGYDQGSIRYPVIYQAPFTLAHWTSSMQLPSVLDSLINSGAIPPEIFVFASSGGGPYVASECADSFDGHEWFDRYLSTTVVQYIDTNFRTIGLPAARGLLGFSEGGYCAATLLFRHPDVFGQAVSLSGYYVAGLQSRSTTNAWRPFNHDPGLIRNASPISLAAALPASVRSRLFIAINGDPTVDPYGPQMASFANVLESSAVPLAVFPTTNAHSWSVVRSALSIVLPMVAARQAALGVSLGGG